MIENSEDQENLGQAFPAPKSKSVGLVKLKHGQSLHKRGISVRSKLLNGKDESPLLQNSSTSLANYVNLASFSSNLNALNSQELESLGKLPLSDRRERKSLIGSEDSLPRIYRGGKFMESSNFSNSLIFNTYNPKNESTSQEKRKSDLKIKIHKQQTLKATTSAENHWPVCAFAANSVMGPINKTNEEKVRIVINIKTPSSIGNEKRTSSLRKGSKTSREYKEPQTSLKLGDKSGIHFFAIFDGHGGSGCADFLEQRFEKLVSSNQA